MMLRARLVLSSLLFTACGPQAASDSTAGSTGGSTSAATGTTSDAVTGGGSLTDAPDPTTGAGSTTTDGASAGTDTTTTPGATTTGTTGTPGTTGEPGTSETGETMTAASDTGDTTDTGAPACGVVGSLVVDDDTDLDALGCIEEVNGDATIGPTIALGSLATLKNLRRVGGSLKIDGNAALVDLTGLDGLEEVGGLLSVRDNAALVTMDGLGALTRVSSLVVEDNSSLVALSSLAGAVEFGPWGQLEFVRLPKLKSFKDLAGLTLITDDSTTIQLRVERNQALTDLTGLAGCDGAHVELAVLGNHALPSLAGLESFTAFDRLEIIANHVIKDLSGLAGVETIEHLVIGALCYDKGFEPSPVGNHGLTSLAGAPKLAAVTEQLKVIGNKKLPVADAEAFRDKVAKQVASDICGNLGGSLCEQVLCPQ